MSPSPLVEEPPSKVVAAVVLEEKERTSLMEEGKGVPAELRHYRAVTAAACGVVAPLVAGKALSSPEIAICRQKQPLPLLSVYRPLPPLHVVAGVAAALFVVPFRLQVEFWL